MWHNYYQKNGKNCYYITLNIFGIYVYINVAIITHNSVLINYIAQYNKVQSNDV